MVAIVDFAAIDIDPAQPDVTTGVELDLCGRRCVQRHHGNDGHAGLAHADAAGRI